MDRERGAEGSGEGCTKKRRVRWEEQSSPSINLQAGDVQGLHACQARDDESQEHPTSQARWCPTLQASAWSGVQGGPDASSANWPEGSETETHIEKAFLLFK